MNNQLSSISTQYRKFSKGQYVEHTQFNEFLDFFEDQDRLSRVMLQGVGIVCGFQPKLIYNKNNKISSIQLSQGIAITTDGDLLTLNNKTRTKKVSDDLYVSELKTIDFTGNQYTHWKPYDNNKVKYPAFYNSDDQIDLWELATAVDATTGFEPLTNLVGFEDKYLLLYLESYEKEVKPCKGVDCDNHGVQQVRNLKVLITNADGILRIFDEDKIYPHPSFLNLTGGEKLKRVILNPVKQSPENLRQAYKNALNQSNYTAMFNNISSITGLLNLPLVGVGGFTERMNNLSDQRENFQYAYCVLKDLTDTCSEIVKLLPKAFTKSLPDLKSFPKHVMLGKLISTTKLDNTRHQFYNSPVLDVHNTDQKLRLLIERFNNQILEFRDPSEMAAEEGIKITPSKDISLLGSKAIPFYYNLTNNFLDAWQFEKTSNRASGSNLSFDTSLLSQGVHIQNPLKYTMDKNTFYRIEGHQKGNYKTVMNNIRDIKNDQQLAFDVMALSLEQLTGNKDISKAYFTEYVEKHPGLEFLGGVKRGGTFVIVYESEANPLVIADFSLPYICCTPKSDVALSLPATTICKDAASLVFNVTPSNGVVKADTDTGYIGGVEKVNGQYMFNPQLVESTLLNKELKFTVNGKPTNCAITVLSDLNVSIYVRSIAYPSSDNPNTVVTFNVSGQNLDQYDYKWDFFGNSKYISLKPDSQGSVVYNYSKIDASKPINVLVSGNGCSQSIILRDWYTPKPVENVGPTIVSITNEVPTEAYWPDARAILNSSVLQGSTAIESYLWTCPDSDALFATPNSFSTGVSFLSTGSYTIGLTVTDSNGLEDTQSITITVGTKASITQVEVSPQVATVNDVVTAQATVYNPSNISGLKFKWYLNDEFIEVTTSNIRSFGKLTLGEQKIEVSISESLNNNHLSDSQSIDFTVFERASGGTSFLAGTLITLANGDRQKIEAVKVGDKLKSLNGTVTVTSIINYTTEEPVYRLNDTGYFITGTHPVYTEGGGWMSFEPEKTNVMIKSIQVKQLLAGQTLLKENNERVVLNNASFTKTSTRAYNIGVDGDKTFFANGYYVYSEI
jgi:hypothetical protein